MQKYIETIDFLKSDENKIKTIETIKDELIKTISFMYKNKYVREYYFLIKYYGIYGNSLTLEQIGMEESSPITRERVRQVIDTIVSGLKTSKLDFKNPYQHSKELIEDISKKNKRDFVFLNELFDLSEFKCFENNIKGLIAFLNDAGVRQIAYRKEYYFYFEEYKRNDIIKKIQSYNKEIRKKITERKMLLKSKTVTYVPYEIRENLLNYSKKNKINLNPLYEKILTSFIKEVPYNKKGFVFNKTKSWKARNGKADWHQIGIFISKDLYEKICEIVINLKENEYNYKNLSVMSFICESFVWFFKNKN